MSNCCFPKLSCINSKNKVRNFEESSGQVSQPSKLKISTKSPSKIQSLNTGFSAFNNSLPNISKVHTSKKKTQGSTIAIKTFTRFEPQQSKFCFDDVMDSIDFSLVSDHFISNDSFGNFFNDIIIEEKHPGCLQSVKENLRSKKNLGIYKSQNFVGKKVSFSAFRQNQLS